MEPATGIATVIVRVGTGDVGVTGFGAAIPKSSTGVMMAVGFAGLAFAGCRSSRTSAKVAEVHLGRVTKGKRA